MHARKLLIFGHRRGGHLAISVWPPAVVSPVPAGDLCPRNGPRPWAYPPASYLAHLRNMTSVTELRQFGHVLIMGLVQVVLLPRSVFFLALASGCPQPLSVHWECTLFFGRTSMLKIAILVISVCALAPAYAQTSVGVSIGIRQPGVYGRIDIGNFPQPRVVYEQPLVIVQSPVAVHRQPIYLYVPPGHQKNWGKHCGQYNACGQPVYFVREDWVRERYQDRRDHEAHGHGHGKSKKHKD
jgi:hypothetical protein